MANINKFQEKVNVKYPNENLTVLEYQGAREYTKIQCDTCGKIYEYTAGGAAIKKGKTVLCHDCIDIVRRKNSFQQKLNDTYPNDNITLITYTNQKQECVIRCNTCGSIAKFSHAEHATDRRKYFCKTCYPQKYDILQQSIQKFSDWINQSDRWELVTPITEIVSSTTQIDCKCTVCGSISHKTMHDYQRGRGCIYCAGTNTKTTDDFIQQLDDGYELLDKYINANTKVTLRHNCGFIYKVTPHNYLCGKRCPHCARKQSKGEMKIAKVLQSLDIEFVQEYPVEVEGHLLRFDFYLPQYNKYIEYQGIQHFEPVEFFGGIERFIKQQEYDNLKQQYDVLCISYKQYDEIEQILANLESSTTISKESTL